MALVKSALLKGLLVASLVAQKIETAFRLLKSTYMSHLSAMHRRASANRVKNVWNLLVDRSEVV